MTKTCSYCGKRFDVQEAEDEFMDDYPQFDYYNFSVPLCSDCAKQAIAMEDTGVYFGTRESCGKHFDYFEELSKYEDLTGGGISDMYENGVLCAECAYEALDE